MNRSRIVWAGAIALVFLPLLAITVWGWREVRISGVHFRYHVMTGHLQLRENDRWIPQLSESPDAPLLERTSLQGVALESLQWGIGGILVGRANLSGQPALRGRLGFSVKVVEPSGTLVRERTLRRNVEWNKDRPNWFVLDTGLPTPSSRQRTFVVLEALN